MRGVFDSMARGGTVASVTFEEWDLEHPLHDRWYGDAGYMAQTFAGFGVTPQQAKRVAAVFACNSLIGETLGSLPCILYRWKDADQEERVRARDHRLYKTLRRVVNRELNLTPMDFFPSQSMNLTMQGRCLSRIEDDGKVLTLYPMDLARTTIDKLPSGRKRYIYHPAEGGEDVLLQDDVLEVRDMSGDGYEVQARAMLAREAIGVATAIEAFYGSFMKNDATGRLVIKHPGNLSPEKRKEFRAMIAENYGGWRKAGEMMFLSHGVEAMELGKVDATRPLTDARNFQAADIARFWRVPGFMIGLPGPTAWGGGIEETVQAFVDFTIKPWGDRWCQAMAMQLLDDDEQDEFFIEFNYNDLLRAKLLERMQSYEIARRTGLMSPNEQRVRENMPKRTDPGGDEYQDTPAGAAPNDPGASRGRPALAPGDRQPADGGATPDAEATRPRVPAALLLDAAERLANAEARELSVRAGKAKDGPEKWRAWLDGFTTQQQAYATRVLTPITAAFALPEWLVTATTERLAHSLRRLSAGIPEGWVAGRSAAIFGLVAQTFSLTGQLDSDDVHAAVKQLMAGTAAALPPPKRRHVITISDAGGKVLRTGSITTDAGNGHIINIVDAAGKLLRKGSMAVEGDGS